MPNEPTQNQPAPAPQGDPIVDATLATAEQIKYFGSDMVGEGAPAEPGDKGEQDNPKTEPTSDPAPAPGSQDKRKLAGKYESPEALEKGYEEQQTYLTTIKREKAELERKLAVLEGNGSQTTKTPGTTPDGAPASATAKDPKLTAILEKAREVGGDEVAELFSSMTEYYESKLAGPGGSAGLSADDPIALTLKHFTEEHPEFAEGEQADKFSAYLAEVSQNSDPMAQLELCRRAYLHQTEPERMDKLIAETTKKVTEARDKYWKSVIYSGSVTLGAATPGDTAPNDQRKAEQAHYFGADMVQ